MCAFPHWADCRSGGDRSASAVVNNKQTLFCSNSLNSLQQVRVGGIFASAVNTSWSRPQIKQTPEQIRYLSSMWKCRCIEKVFPPPAAPPSGLWSFGWDWSIRRPRESGERRANELRVAVFYGCENQPADAAAARKISLQCMSVTKHTVQRCHSKIEKLCATQ